MIKTVGTASYVHKSNVQELIEKKVAKPEIDTFKLFLQNVSNIQYDIIKYDKGNITLISSPDWDTANEPIVGTCYRYKKGAWFNKPTIRDNYKQIYHNKWMFVSNTYAGFDIEKAKERTKIWNSLPNLDKKRIGYKSYWVKYLERNGVSI